MNSNVPKKMTVKSDWHRADIVAALHKKGWSLRQLSFHHGYKSASAMKNALDKSWLKGEQIIADIIGVPPEDIWPTRYATRVERKFANLESNED